MKEKMDKFPIDIPKGIEYIGQWKDYKIPRGEHCIVDKGVTGCGYTEMCLLNNDPIVLCSPRKLLLENKSEKHLKLKHYNIVYLDSLTLESMMEIVERQLDYCYRENLVPKFLITYDSTGKIIECLKKFNILDNFIFIVDEFQSIFLDSYFKVGVEFDFVNNLQECSSVVYLSATPMLEKYLVKINEFKDLPFYKLDWTESGFVETVTIERKKTQALTTECCKIVKNYLNNKFPLISDKDNIIYESKEAVFYFNSVAEILRVVRKCHLTPENTLIVCSKSENNLQKLRKEGFTFGKIPLEDESNPMFTFCTSAVYMGVDFYSDNACSYVFADPNVECLALDISLDLPQIIGRQRNKNNPFKNNIVLFYKTKRKDELELSEENFKEYQRKKKEDTVNLLNLFERATKREKEVYTQKLLESIEYSNYSRDFVSISEKTGKPIYNSLIEIADKRAWDVSQKDYQDTISVTRAISNLDNLRARVIKYEDDNEKIINTFINDFFNKTNIFREKMYMYCEFSDLYKDNEYVMNSLYRRIEDPRFLQYYRYYGTKGCSSRRYIESELESGWRDATKTDLLREEIYKTFSVGDRIAMSDIKLILSKIYKKLNLSKSAKATDLGDYFKLSKTNTKDSSGVLKKGFNLKEKLL